MPEIAPAIETFARIKVVGIGGGGGAAVNRMIDEGVSGVEFVAINTDAQALHHSKAKTKVHIGREVTKGLGAGADPVVGREAAEESRQEIKKILEDTDMVFVTFGAGGGTGSGAGPIVAELAKEAGILVVGIATKPFAFEGDKRKRNAEDAINNLSKQVDTLITIPNDRLLQTIDRRTPLLEAFKVADDVLRQGVQGISDLITIHGLINLDFADVRTVMSGAGSALMGIGRASGENRAIEAAQQAIESPLLEVSIDGARGVLFNISGGPDMSMHEINEAAESITAAVDPDANIIFGATLNPSMEDEIAITVIATGFDASYFKRPDGFDDLQENTVPNLSKTSMPSSLTSESNDSEAEEIVSGIDMDISSKPNTSAEEFADSDDDSNIWNYSDQGEELDTPAFVRRSQEKKDEKKKSGFFSRKRKAKK